MCGGLEDFGGGGGVDVGILLEGGDHGFVAGEGCHDAEFDLGVVAGEEGEVLGIFRDEGAADAAADFGADGDVLEVGVGGGEAPGGDDPLVEVGVDALGGGLDVGGECVDVGGFEFGGFAPGEDVWDDGVSGLEGEEGLFVGFELSGFGFFGFVGEVEVVEEDVAELFGGGEVEGCTGVLLDACFEFLEACFELVRNVGECEVVDADALALHAHEDGEEGCFAVLVEGLHA